MAVSYIQDYNWKGKKVLIVEDDPAGALLLSEILHKTNILIQVVESGSEAVEICSNDLGINILILDMQTPGISGYEAAKHIRKIRKDLPIIAQSAFVLQEEKKHAIEAGCNTFISKPINTFELLSTMQEFLK